MSASLVFYYTGLTFWAGVGVVFLAFIALGCLAGYGHARRSVNQLVAGRYFKKLCIENSDYTTIISAIRAHMGSGADKKDVDNALGVLVKFMEIHRKHIDKKEDK